MFTKEQIQELVDMQQAIKGMSRDEATLLCQVAGWSIRYQPNSSVPAWVYKITQYPKEIQLNVLSGQISVFRCAWHYSVDSLRREACRIYGEQEW